MAKKLYVGGLSENTTGDSLKELFSQAGTVESATVITDKMTGGSRGFGFVEMSSDEEAQKAIATFDGKELDGRNITVNEARPQNQGFHPRQGGFQRQGGGGFDGPRGRGGSRGRSW